MNGEYSDDMRLSPMIEILNNSDWTSQVEAWAETFEEQQIYEIQMCIRDRSRGV